MLQSFQVLSSGRSASESTRRIVSHGAHQAAGIENAFQRLARTYREGETLVAELQRTEYRLAQARAYVAGRGSHSALGRTQAARLLERMTSLRERLEVQAVEAQELLGIPNPQKNRCS